MTAGRLEVAVTALTAALSHSADAYDVGHDLSDCDVAEALAGFLDAAGGHGLAVRRGHLRETCDDPADVCPVRAWDAANDSAGTWTFTLALMPG